MPDTTAPDAAAEAREILAAAELVTIPSWPTDRRDALRVQADNIDPAAVSVDSIAIHHGRNGNPREAFRALTAAADAMRAAGWYVLPLSGVMFRTGPGELKLSVPAVDRARRRAELTTRADNLRAALAAVLAELDTLTD